MTHHTTLVCPTQIAAWRHKITPIAAKILPISIPLQMHMQMSIHICEICTNITDNSWISKFVLDPMLSWERESKEVTERFFAPKGTELEQVKVRRLGFELQHHSKICRHFHGSSATLVSMPAATLGTKLLFLRESCRIYRLPLIPIHVQLSPTWYNILHIAQACYYLRERVWIRLHLLDIGTQHSQ